MKGYTLIECMVAVAILGIGTMIFTSHFQQYQRASDRTYAIEGLARVVDVEMERARACEDEACVRKMSTATATTAGVSAEANSWVRARVKRTVKPGPDGTLEVTISAELDGLPEQRLTSLVWVGR